MAKVEAVKVGTGPAGSVYFVINPSNKALDGLVGSADEGYTPIPFWSYVTRMPVVRTRDTEFHAELWSQKSERAWEDVFFFRNKPIPGATLETAAQHIELIDAPSTLDVPTD